MQQEATKGKRPRSQFAEADAAAGMSAEAIAGRLTRLGALSLKQALPMLLLELDQLRAANLDAEERVELLQAIKKPVLKAAASLPKPTPGSRTALRTADGGMTLEQRLIHLMIANLRQCLYEYDRAQGSRLVEDDGHRTWLLQQVFRFFGRQLRYAVDWDRAWPTHTWQDLHDLFVYLVVRGSVTLDSGFAVAVFDDEFDAAIEYKRLLLLGLVDELTHRASASDAYFHLLKRWSFDSSLVEPEKLLGRRDLIQVLVTKDAPPHLKRGALETSFRGWVLRPAEGCIGYIMQQRRTRPSGRAAVLADVPAAVAGSSAQRPG
ncbi:MAG: hypothetical protein LJE69_10765 [Thiohalocapsa sp.]|jgi:hypothetical protein|uniref:hypothetical protein n=1 Tax=Thiohalocapsa sp. TaxID=2497641 RepID=UPI0025FD6A4A|nr:hypothetical protein [Thiohalocapsa sp.]MCG6941718.1 hypothetical protein [Thiohalocapsa sp.]